MANRLKPLVLLLLICSCLGPLDPYNPAPTQEVDSGDPNQTPSSLPTGLIAHWTCNDSAGTELRDEGGNYTGRLFGCTWEAEGVDDSGGYAVSFDGLDDYISISSNDSAFDFGEGEFTISLWAKPLITKAYTDSARYDIITNGVVEENGFALSIYKQRFFSAYFAPRAEEKHSGDSLHSAKEHKWFHCVMLRRKNGTSMDVELYVDGDMIQSYNNSTNVSSNTNALIMGCDAELRRENFYQGLVDEIKVLNYAWDSYDVTSEFNRFSPN